MSKSVENLNSDFEEDDYLNVVSSKDLGILKKKTKKQRKRVNKPRQREA